MYSHEHDISLSTDICLIIPWTVLCCTGYINNFICYIFAVLCKLEPDLVTLDIDLLCYKCKSTANVKWLASSDGEFLVAVCDQLGQFFCFTLNWDVFCCKESDLVVCLAKCTPWIVFIRNVLDCCGIDECFLSDCPRVSHHDVQRFWSYIIIDVVIESCERCLIPYEIRCTACVHNGTSYFMCTRFCDLLHEVETDIIGWICHLDLHSVWEVDDRVWS